MKMPPALRRCRRSAYERLTTIGGLRRQADLDEHEHVEADRLGREHRAVALNDTGLLQRRPAARTLRGGQADPLGQLVVGEPAVLLEGLEQLDVEFIHASLSRKFSI